MAIYHATCKPISRGNGHSSTAKAAYIGCKQVTDNRTGQVFKYSDKHGFLGGDIILPEGIDLEISNSKLWNMAEANELRKDARVGREWEISLPHELDNSQRKELAIDITKYLANRYGVACEYALHAPAKNGDDRNYHVHILTTTRKINIDGSLGRKSDIEMDRKQAAKLGIPTSQEQIKQIRKMIADTVNHHLSLANISEKVSHLSYEDQGIDLVPGVHKGKAVTEMERRGVKTLVSEIANERQEANKQVIELKSQNFNDGSELASLQSQLFSANEKSSLELQNGEINQILNLSQVSKIIANVEYHDSVFMRSTLEKNLKKVFTDYRILEKSVDEILQAKNIISLGFGDDGKERFTTAKMLGIEKDIQVNVRKLQQLKFDVYKNDDKVLADYELVAGKKLTDEQNKAVKHITGENGIACIVGRAGTGKSFSLAAAKAVWDSQRANVHGIAISGIATSGLSKDAKINSRTVASFLLAVESGSLKLNSSSVIVMDEAGMTDSLSMQQVIAITEAAKCKLVLVGDPAQLQPVGPGASFRAILEKTGFAEIQTVYRQKEEWQRQATVNFSQANTSAAIQAYYDHDCVQLLASSDAAIDMLSKDWQAKRHSTDKDISKFLVVAHRNADVELLNSKLRELRVKNNEIAEGYKVSTIVGNKAREIKLAVNDRIIFLRNDKMLGVANGRFATVNNININESGEIINFMVKLDDSNELVEIDPKKYSDFDYGYAATVHKTQGVTVDHSFVYGGGNLNSSLTYVAMTRHKESTCLYASETQYEDLETLKDKVSRLDSKDSVLHYLDEIDDYAARRGIDTNQKTLKNIVVDYLKTAKDRIIELASGLPKHSIVVEPVAADSNANIVEPVVSPIEYAKVVAKYAQANKDFMSAYGILNTKLAELGFEKVSYKSEDYAVISKLIEYQDTVRLYDLKSELAHSIKANLEPSKVALELNKVNLDKLGEAAIKHETRLRVEAYANAVKYNLPERYKLASDIAKDMPEHFVKLNVNNIDIEQVRSDSNAWLFEQIKQNQETVKFVTFDNTVRGYLEILVERAKVMQELGSEVTEKPALEAKLSQMDKDIRIYADKFESLYSDELLKWGGNDKEISIIKNGGYTDTYRRYLDNELTPNDMSAISRHVAGQNIAPFLKARVEYFKLYKENSDLIAECKAKETKFELTEQYPAYLKAKIAYEECGVSISQAEAKTYERALNAYNIAPAELEKCVTFLPRDKSTKLCLNYLSLDNKDSREAYKLAYEITSNSSNYYTVQQLGLSNDELQSKTKELITAHVLKEAGIEPLASQIPGAAHIDIISKTTENLSNVDNNLDKFILDYFKAQVIQDRVFTAKIGARDQGLINYYENILKENRAKISDYQNKFKENDYAKELSTKYDETKYNFANKAMLRGGNVAAYQRALQGKSTAEDFAATNKNLSYKVSQSISHGHSIKL